MKTLKLLLVWVGVMVSHQAMAWCGGDGTPDCSATYYHMIDQTSPYYQGGGGGYSGPIVTQPPKIVILPDSWGAFAQSPTTGLWGAASKQAALQNCIATGANDCKVLEVYKNTCIVLTNISLATDPNLQKARQVAMSRCSRDNKECRIVYEECMP